MSRSGEANNLLTFVDALRALSDPVRLDLLVRIASIDEMACTTLVEQARVSASTVSYHVKLLKAAKLVHVRKEGRNYHYRVNPTEMLGLARALSDALPRPADAMDESLFPSGRS